MRFADFSALKSLEEDYVDIDRFDDIYERLLHEIEDISARTEDNLDTEIRYKQKELDRLRERVIAGNFANFDGRAKTIYTRVSSIYPALESLKAPELPWALILVASIGAISATILIFLIRARAAKKSRSRKKHKI